MMEWFGYIGGILLVVSIVYLRIVNIRLEDDRNKWRMKAENRDVDIQNIVDDAFLKGEHISSEHCWCKPRLDYVHPISGDAVWRHNETRH